MCLINKLSVSSYAAGSQITFGRPRLKNNSSLPEASYMAHFITSFSLCHNTLIARRPSLPTIYFSVTISLTLISIYLYYLSPSDKFYIYLKGPLWFTDISFSKKKFKNAWEESRKEEPDVLRAPGAIGTAVFTPSPQSGVETLPPSPSAKQPSPEQSEDPHRPWGWHQDRAAPTHHSVGP